MPLDLDTVQKIINSPPGQLAAGGVLASIVWKFFERVEALLTDDTKLEIAVWLLGVKAGDQIAIKVRTWPTVFLTVFDSVFTSRPLSWSCFWRSCLATYGCIALSFIPTVSFPSSRNLMFSMLSQLPKVGVAILVVAIVISILVSLPIIAVINGIPNYIALLKTRYALQMFARYQRTISRGLLLIADISGSLLIAFGLFFTIKSMAWYVFHRLPGPSPDFQLEFWPYMHGQIRGIVKGDMPLQLLLDCYPALFGIAWFSLYAVSGLLLTGGRRFDTGFQWFTRRFDIEKKPLQSIGLVAGALTALLYWGAVLVAQVF